MIDLFGFCCCWLRLLDLRGFVGLRVAGVWLCGNCGCLWLRRGFVVGVAGVLGWVGSGVGLVLIVLVAPCDLAFMCRLGIVYLG